MTWGLANPLMLLGLAGVTIPVLIHLLHRRRYVVVEWGAMMFLDLGRRARRKIELTELLLMAGRMLLLGLLALALARPFWSPRDSGSATNASSLLSASAPRDVVLVLDGSQSMDRRDGDATPRDRALAWARAFAASLPAGSTAGILLARDRVQPLTIGLSADLDQIRNLLEGRDLPPSHGASDLAAAMSEALHMLEFGRHDARDVILLSDAQRAAWRLGEPARWALLRDLHREFQRRSGVEPGLWAITFTDELASNSRHIADVLVSAIDLPRALVPPGRPLEVRATIENAGPAARARTAELILDGQPVPGTAQTVGPLPARGRASATFNTTLQSPGGHAVGVRLVPDDRDPLPANDANARAVTVVPAIPVLLVDGEPGLEPLSSETDFLRAALAPRGDNAPPVTTTVLPLAQFDSTFLDNAHVLVLANVDRLTSAQDSAISRFLAHGRGVLVAPGDRQGTAPTPNSAGHWLSATLGTLRGDFRARQAVAHPAPASFSGPLAVLAKGEAPPLADAELFAYYPLTPAKEPSPAVVLARLDNGDPWIVERPQRNGRVILLAGPIDAEGGTLPVNPDFVPLVHELILRLADCSANAHNVHPGEPLSIPLDPPPPSEFRSIAVTSPSGQPLKAAIEREGPRARARLDRADESGLYRFALPTPAGAFRYAEVADDPRENDLSPLTSNDIANLTDSWPLTIENNPSAIPTPLRRASRSGPRPLWRLLILAAIAGLCLELLATRRLARQWNLT